VEDVGYHSSHFFQKEGSNKTTMSVSKREPLALRNRILEDPKLLVGEKESLIGMYAHQGLAGNL
jgi:hypothetical protein